MSIVPQVQKLGPCYVGANWNTSFVFWDDTPKTIPHDFSGYTLSFVVEAKSQTFNAHVTVSGNSVAVAFFANETASFPARLSKYKLMMTDNSNPNSVEYLYIGPFDIQAA